MSWWILSTNSTLCQHIIATFTCLYKWFANDNQTCYAACVSPADSNAEETLNTLKYANRARNIQNKPTVNRDPMAAEMQRMRQQLEVMQAELICARGGGPSTTDVQVLTYLQLPHIMYASHNRNNEDVVCRTCAWACHYLCMYHIFLPHFGLTAMWQLLKQKIAWLEASNLEFRREVEENRARIVKLAQETIASQVILTWKTWKWRSIPSLNFMFNSSVCCL